MVHHVKHVVTIASNMSNIVVILESQKFNCFQTNLLCKFKQTFVFMCQSANDDLAINIQFAINLRRSQKSLYGHVHYNKITMNYMFDNISIFKISIISPYQSSFAGTSVIKFVLICMLSLSNFYVFWPKLSKVRKCKKNALRIFFVCLNTKFCQ